jgi:putative zinc finger protein
VTHNDEQIDLLMRRFARAASGANGAPDHLDADEMNAFAEGALPPAARARYVSHLANCDDCRKQVAQLAITSGAVVRAEQNVANRPERGGFWATLTGMFTLPALRYAAFAAIVVVVAGVGFVALRHRSERPNLVAANEPLPSQQTRDVAPSANTNSVLNDKNDSSRSNAASPPSATSASPPVTLSNPNTKQGEDHIAENTTPPPVMMKEAAKSVEESEKKAEQVPVRQSETAQTQQSYAPAPPGEAQGGVRGQSQTAPFVFGGGLKTQTPQAADKAQSADRERDTNKDVQLASNQPGGRLYDEKMKSGPSRNMDNVAANNQNANEVRAETPKKPAVAERTEQTPQSRSTGGHKFRRQGNSWVDQKFKSSMPLRNVSRGSEDYAALDAGLRSIAQQVSGEVIIVWKGKAYLIK